MSDTQDGTGTTHAGVSAPVDFALDYRPDVIQVSDTPGAAWSLVGGGEDDELLVLHLVVAHPTEPSLVARVRLEIPLVAGDGILHVGETEVEAL